MGNLIDRAAIERRKMELSSVVKDIKFRSGRIPQRKQAKRKDRLPSAFRTTLHRVEVGLRDYDLLLLNKMMEITGGTSRSEQVRMAIQERARRILSGNH